MANWTSIADATLEPGKPIRAIDARALRDNPIAIAQGASGAPKIAGQQGPAVETGGITDLNVTTAKIANGAVTNAKIQPPTAGTGNLIMRLQEQTVTSASPAPTAYLGAELHNRLAPTQHLGCTVLVAGTVTAYLEHRNFVTSSNATSDVRVLVNGNQIAAWSNNTATFVGRSVNVTCGVGDQIIFQAKYTPFVFDDGPYELRRLRIYSNNPNFAVA